MYAKSCHLNIYLYYLKTISKISQFNFNSKYNNVCNTFKVSLFDVTNKVFMPKYTIYAFMYSRVSFLTLSSNRPLVAIKTFLQSGTTRNNRCQITFEELVFFRGLYLGLQYHHKNWISNILVRSHGLKIFWTLLAYGFSHFRLRQKKFLFGTN